MLIRFITYGLIGWALEIVFTGIQQPYESNRINDWRLEGKTQLWTFPIWGSLVFLYEPLHRFLAPVAWPIRGLVYAECFMLVELIAGLVIKYVIGRIPWDYSKATPLHVAGAVRLDYLPLWFAAGMLLEPVHDFLVSVVP